MKRYVCTIIAVICSIFAIASNTLTLSSVSGTPQTEVEVVVSLDNTDAITALEMVLPLGEHLSYVNGSATLATARSNGHMLSAAQVGQDLRIYVYSFSQNALQGNTGELLSFRIKLGNEPATYALTPTIVMSNAQGTALEATAQAGNVTIQAPKLQILTEQIDFGHIPIRATYSQDLQLYNAGTLPLIIENVVVNDPAFSPAQTALTIEAGEVAYTTIHYAPTVRGAIQKEVLVTSNAINGEQVVAIVADPFSVNELHVGSASGIADSIVTIALTMNNMEPIVAMQCAFVLPEQLEYVANSLLLNSTRSNGHVALSTVNKFVEKENQWYDSKGDTLVLMLYSMTNQPLLHNDGEIATFQLHLNGNSGGYGLYPQDVVLSNITEENMVSAIYEGWVNIQSPSLYGTDDLHFGNCPITETAIAAYSFNNYGDAPLQIERVTFLAEGYHVVTPLPLVVNPWEEGSLQIAYDPKLEGDFSTTMNLYTNDPTNRLKAIALSGHVYEPNSLTIEGMETSDGKYQLAISLNNYTDIVALQYDIHWRSDMTTSQAAFTPTARLQNHSYSIVRMDVDTYRVLIYSLVNSPIIGSSGELHQLIFTPQGEANYCDNVITIDNIVLSNSNGTDKVSESTISYYTPSTQYVEEMQTAYNQYIWHNRIYNESGTYIDTLQTITGCDSIVTLHLTINIYENVIACDSYTWHGETYTESGDYEYRTTLENGCERVEILHLTINSSEREEYYETACDTYEWHGEVYTESGVYEYRTTTEQGCERVEVLYLTIYNSQYEEYWETACDEYWWHGNQYTESGEYTYSYPIYDWGTGTCDRTEVLHLTINKRDTVHYYETACDEYFWNQNWQYYYESGDYENYTTNEYGCERVEILHLTINRSKREEYWINACDTYEWHGNTYTESGVYEYRITTEQGCEHVEVLHLAINRSEREEYDVTACNQYEWHGDLYTESGIYEYRTNKTETEKLYVGYDSEHDPIIGLTPPRGISRFTVDGFITNGSGACFVGTGTPVDEEADNSDLRIFDAGCFYYDRMSGRNSCFFYDFREPFNIEFGNYYAKNLETGAYYFNEGNNVYEYSNTEYPLTLFYKDYGKIHKVQFFDNNNLLWADINAVLEGGLPMIKIDYYEADGTIYHTQKFTENLYVETKTISSCERVEILHLTINRSKREEYWIKACDAYEWHGETYTQSGDYEYRTTTEQGCERVEVLHLTIYNSQYEEYWETACDEYWWHGNQYTESGEYTYSYPIYDWGTGTCDRTEVLHLTINKRDTVHYYETACDEYFWNQNWQYYYESGDYENYTTNEYGCERVEILHLTINRSKREEYWINACDTYEWHGNTYTESGVYEYRITTEQGCEHVEVLHLAINRSEREEYDVTACDQYEWHGYLYTESGDYEYRTNNTETEKLYVGYNLEHDPIIGLTPPRGISRFTVDGYITNGSGACFVGTGSPENGIADDEGDLRIFDAGCFYYDRMSGRHDCFFDDYRYPFNIEFGNYYAKNLETGAYYFNEGNNVYEYSNTEYPLTLFYKDYGKIHKVQFFDNNNLLWADINAVLEDGVPMITIDYYNPDGTIYYTQQFTENLHAETKTICSCGRVEILHLTINNTQYAEETVTACDNYTWNGETYTESGEYTYTTTAANGCDSIVTLHLTINQSEVGDTEYATICYGETYTWNGQTYAATGEYSVTLTNAAGCDSIATLHLTIMPEAVTSTETVVIGSDDLPYTWRGNTYLATGRYIDIEQYTQVDCDSAIHVLDLTVLTTGNFDEESITICEIEAPYIWYGESYTATGKYTYTEKYAGTDIDSVQHILNLTVNPTVYTEESMVACDSYTWNGETYTTSGEYTYTTTATNGCDSIIILHLTINATKYAEETVTACDSYVWNGETYTASGEYTYTTNAANGCDSIVTLHLTINETQYAEETVVACDSYVWNGETYITSGEYTYTTNAANGCDSIVTLHLTINETQYAEETVVACDSYTWNGETYTQSGDYVYTTTATNGCDSIVTLHLTVNQTQYTEEVIVACDTYIWNGETYTQSGEYAYTTTAVNGCDSVVTLHLTVNQTQYTEESVTACDTYIWNGETYTQSGEYAYTTTAANGCDSVVTLHLTILPDAVTETEELVLCSSELPYEWYGELITEAGFYTVSEQYAAGCDSVVHELRLNVYNQSLPEQVTLPIVRRGEAIDVTVPSAEIYAHIASDSWYAPNALVEWYTLEDAEWIVLTTDPVPSGVKQVTLKYAVDTDCGSVESDEMVISLETTNVENSQSGNIDTYKIFRDGQLLIIRDGKTYNAQGAALQDGTECLWDALMGYGRLAIGMRIASVGRDVHACC